MNQRAFAVLVTVLAIVAVAVGCGGSDDSLTKAEFTRRADAICKKGEEERIAGVQENGQDFRNKISKKAMAAIQKKLLTSVIVTTLETESDELAALGVPDGDEDEVDAILAAHEQVVDKVRKSGLDEESLGEFSKLAREYGLEGCASV